MNLLRIFLAALAAFIVYMAAGGLFFALPSTRSEFLKHSAVYRDQQGQMSHMAIGMPAMFVAMIALAVLYAMLYRGGSGLFEGASFGLLIALFFVCTFVIHNYVNLNISLKLTLQQPVAYTLEWVLVGIVIGLIYRPAH